MTLIYKIKNTILVQRKPENCYPYSKSEDTLWIWRYCSLFFENAYIAGLHIYLL